MIHRPSESAAAPSVANERSTAFERIDGALDCGVLLLCDHASNELPQGYGDLGLPRTEFERHIAYDIGAAVVTRTLARLWGAPAILSTFSRLLIDPNRGADDPTLVMRISDGAIVPGNARIDADEILHRRATYWQPYRGAVTDTIDRMLATGVAPALIAIHSFTPYWKEFPRPWHIGVLWDNDPRIAVPLVAEIAKEPDVLVGENEPYDGALDGDMMDTNGTRRGLAHCLVELRQDLITRPGDAIRWAGRLAGWLQPVLAQPRAHIIDHHGSRAWGPRPSPRIPNGRIE